MFYSSGNWEIKNKPMTSQQMQLRKHQEKKLFTHCYEKYKDFGYFS